jgi:hypothetical protein
MSQITHINKFHSIVSIACDAFIQSHGLIPTTLFLGPNYQKALSELVNPSFAHIPFDATVTVETFQGLTIYPIGPDVLLVGIVTSSED